MDKPLRTLEKLRALQFLDLSKDRHEQEIDFLPPVVDATVLHVLSTLPRLTSLDISGKVTYEYHKIKQGTIFSIGRHIIYICAHYILGRNQLLPLDLGSQLLLIQYRGL